MAIWLVARACGARLPRRLVYVVDRRAVVDQATEVALSLRNLVDDDPELKGRLGIRNGRSLSISTLRGQYVDNREWLEDPAGPAIIVGTVDMVGSRLLFEGYGVSRKMRPYHAGLLGADTLVVLDEAHLVPPFEHLLRSVATEPGLRPQCQRWIPPFRVLALSATGRTRGDDVVRLTQEDAEHEVVRRRLNARKSLRIEALEAPTKIEDALAKQAWRLADDGREAVRVLIYSNSREVALKAREAVKKLAKGDRRSGKTAVTIETELFVGARRVFEREEAKERLTRLGFIAGSVVERTCPVFLFATSAGEVGVDLDADHMVCDLVAWERMVQRLGRVNRRGDGQASVVVVVQPKPEPTKAERDAIEKLKDAATLKTKDRQNARERAAGYNRKIQAWKTVTAIESLGQNEDRSFDASPGSLQDLKVRAATDKVLRRVLDEATTPEPLRPALTRPLVEAWAMTSLSEHPGRPAIQPWLRGWIENDPPQTAVVWRKHLPVRADGPAPGKKEVEAFFEAAPPHMSEVLETETFRVAKWIAERVKSVRKHHAEQESAGERPPLREHDVVAFALEPDGKVRKSFTLAELDPSPDKDGRKKLSETLSGAVLIVDARLAGLKKGLLERKEPGIPRTADDGEEWLGEGGIGFRVSSVEASQSLVRDGNWHERLRFPAAISEDGEATHWLVVEKWRRDAATEDDRSCANPQLLDEHLSWTEERARDLASALDLDGALTDVLALAARLHDEGKRAERWQRAFHAPEDGVWAKTNGPIDYNLLDGYRHELGSLLLIQDDERVRCLPDEHRDLLLHLIAAHHGFARPVIPTGGCEYAPPSALEEKAAEIALRFARLMDRWGPWGLAWWEALLRAADQQASRDNDARGTGGEPV